MAENSSMPVLESWGFVRNQGPYTPPECSTVLVQGRVYGHPTRPDGRPITTSRVVEILEGVIVTRSGSRYRLGEPHPTYAEQYPEEVAKAKAVDAPDRIPWEDL